MKPARPDGSGADAHALGSIVRARRGALIVAFAALAGALWLGEDASEPHGPLPVDQRVLEAAVDHRSGLVVGLARVVSHLGDPVVLILLAVVVTAWLWRRGPGGLAALVPAVALVVAAAIEAATKQLVGRPRPPVVFHLLAESDASFPSGHATGSAAFYVAFALALSPMVRRGGARAALVAGAAALAALVGWARVVLGVHWVTDVGVGWLLGVAVALAAAPLAEAVVALAPRSWPVRFLASPTDAA